MATATVAYEEPRKHKLVPGSRVLIEPGLHPAGSGATGHPQLGYVVRVKGKEALVADADGENWYKLDRLTPDGYVSPDYAAEMAAESGLSDYIAQTKIELARLGSPDPAADIKAQHETLARLRKAGLPPNVAASTIYSLERGFSPEMLRAGEKPSEAREYVAVDHAGKYVFGPTRDFQEAKFHADRAHGYVKWGDEAAECLGLHTHGAPPAGTVVVAAAEGPHSQPSTAPAASCCTKESSIEIARQIPGGPWAYVRSYPREAPARIERQQDYVIGGKTVTASFCGKYLLLRCPTNGTQYLFEGACIVDPAKPAPPAVVAVKGKPFTVRIKQGKTLVAELGPFAKITDAKAALDKTGKPGQVAGIYEDGKVADYRGDKAVFGFGRTRWSRA